jgi:pyruvate formate lyase activating enzyme
VIGRDWYEITCWDLTDGRCDRYGTDCAGVFDGLPGGWGPRPQPLMIEADHIS